MTEHVIDVYFLDGKLVPWTPGIALAARIDVLSRTSLPPRVRRFRMRLLQEQLIAYCLDKWGNVPVNAHDLTACEEHTRNVA